MESMINFPSPTRAEVSDVATAVYSGADATMLSAESASGQHPIEAVSMMSRIIAHVEKDRYCVRYIEDDSQIPQRTVVDAICAAAKDAAEYSEAKAIVLFTESFETVVRCSRLRPRTPIIFVNNSKRLADKAALCYGVYSVVAKKEFDMTVMSKTAKEIVLQHKFAEAGDNIVVLNDISGCSIDLCGI